MPRVSSQATTSARSHPYGPQSRAGSEEAMQPDSLSSPILEMQDMPPSTIHKYVMHYGLTPAANTTNTVYGNVALLAPLTFQQAVMPCPPPSSLYTHPRLLAAEQTALLLQTSISSDDLPKQDPLTDLVEGTCEDLKTPAIDGQEPTEADGRLVDLVTQHWDKVQVKEGETIVNFMYAIRMKNKVLKLVPQA